MNNSKDFLILNNTSEYKNRFERNFNSDYIPVNDSFVFAIQKQKCISYIHGDLNPFTENIFFTLKENSEKENLYITAIENLLKQKEYLNLAYQMSHNLISNDEFHDELEKNEDKYLIRIDDHFDTNRFRMLLKILGKIKYNFSDDDVSEIFSIDAGNITSYLNIHNNKHIEDENSIR
jgi:hypothetical protein